MLAGAGSILGAGCLDADLAPPLSEDAWTMYGRDPGRTRHAPDADVPTDGVSVRWKRKTGAGGWRPPVVTDDALYCKYSNALFVLDPDSGDGREVGTYGGFGGDGPMAFGRTEAYRDGALLVPYGGDVAGYVADPDSWPKELQNDGRDRLRWISGDGRTEPPVGALPSDSTVTGPVVVEGTVVFEDRFDDGIRAVDVDDGRTVWEYALRDDEELSVRPTALAVDLTTGTVVTDARSAVAEWRTVGIDLETGSRRWVQTHDGYDRTLAADGGRVFAASPSPDDAPVELSAIDAPTGAAAWNRTVDADEPLGLAVDETRCYHAGRVDGDPPTLRVMAVSRDDGTTVWTVDLGDASHGLRGADVFPPTVAGPLVIVPEADRVTALYRDTGERAWTFSDTVPTSGGGTSPRRPTTPPVVAHDRIYLAATLALYALDSP